jgi:hypothetical protein
MASRNSREVQVAKRNSAGADYELDQRDQQLEFSYVATEEISQQKKNNSRHQR